MEENYNIIDAIKNRQGDTTSRPGETVALATPMHTASPCLYFYNNDTWCLTSWDNLTPKDLFGGPYVIKSEDIYYCGNDQAFNLCNSKTTRSMAVLFEKWFKAVLEGGLKLEKFMVTRMNWLMQYKDAVEVLGGTFMQEGEECEKSAPQSQTSFIPSS